MEQYVVTQDLVVWMSSTLGTGPSYDPARKRWAIIVRKNSVPYTLRPQHLVFAVSSIGDPHIPILPGQEDSRGTIQHSSTFTGGEPFEGRKVLVVGAGNSSADICQDLVFRGASSVTLLQRSSTAVISAKSKEKSICAVFAPGVPSFYSDLKLAGMPLGALREIGSQWLRHSIRRYWTD